MAVKIRLRRMGQKKLLSIESLFLILDHHETENSSKKSGTYDPTQDPSVFKVDEEAAKKWLNNGAQPTEVVGKIFKGRY